MTEAIQFTHIQDARILVVEDEESIRRLVKRTVEEYGGLINEAENLRSARTLCASWRPDMIILDLGLPDGDGNDLITEVRAYSQVPIIILSARVNENDKVKALMAGADDYLTKPFSSVELLARVEAALRRRRTVENSTGAATTVKLGECEIDLANHVFTKAGKVEHLTKVEWRLLEVLIKHQGKVLTHRNLLSEVWGPIASGHTHYLRIYIQRLRNKIEPDPITPHYILTEIGIGYRLVDETQATLFSARS